MDKNRRAISGIGCEGWEAVISFSMTDTMMLVFGSMSYMEPFIYVTVVIRGSECLYLSSGQSQTLYICISVMRFDPAYRDTFFIGLGTNYTLSFCQYILTYNTDLSYFQICTGFIIRTYIHFILVTEVLLTSPEIGKARSRMRATPYQSGRTHVL